MAQLGGSGPGPSCPQGLQSPQGLTVESASQILVGWLAGLMVMGQQSQFLTPPQGCLSVPKRWKLVEEEEGDRGGSPLMM